MQERLWLVASPWVWTALAFIVAILSVAGWAIWQDAPRMLWWLLVPGYAVFVLAFGNLRIDSRNEVLSLRYFPLWRRRIRWVDIEAAGIERYKPLRFGGWGVRYSPRAIAFSVVTGHAVRLHIRGRRLHVIFTTRDPAAWLEEIQRHASATAISDA